MEETLRITHLISPLKLYGKEKWLLALLRHIDRDRYLCSVVMLTDEEHPALSHELEKEGIEFSLVRCKKISLHDIIAAVAEIATERRIDIIHTHDYRADILGFFSARRARTSIVSTPHGWSNAPDLKLQMYQAFNKLLLPFFDRVVPLSPTLHRRLKRYCRRNTRMIRNFIDISALPEPRVGDKGLISFVGRLTWLKRVRDTISALRFTRDASVRLQIIGDGPLNEELRRYAARLNLDDRVTFLGFRDDALDLLNRSAALVLPSLTEGISRVAMEAMALGKPVIGTDIPGIRILVDDGRTGMLVPRKDPRAIARAIDTLLYDEALYSAMGGAARDFILRTHAAEVVVREYEELYREMADR
jgi:glycosyltransferase involved in cell wall biosynthesis